jgi:hypothetical protein
MTGKTSRNPKVNSPPAVDCIDKYHVSTNAKQKRGSKNNTQGREVPPLYAENSMQGNIKKKKKTQFVQEGQNPQQDSWAPHTQISHPDGRCTTCTNNVRIHKLCPGQSCSLKCSCTDHACQVSAGACLPPSSTQKGKVERPMCRRSAHTYSQAVPLFSSLPGIISPRRSPALLAPS